jgi:hypothetical protein
VYALRSAEVIVERPLRSSRSGSEESLEEGRRMDVLPLGGLYEATDDAVGLEPHFGSDSEAHFAEDDHVWSNRTEVKRESELAICRRCSRFLGRRVCSDFGDIRNVRRNRPVEAASRGGRG